MREQTGGGGEVDGEEVVLLGHGAFVVVEEEVVAGDGDGEPGEDGGGEAPPGQLRVVLGAQLDCGGRGEVRQSPRTGLALVFCLLFGQKLRLGHLRTGRRS